MNVSSAQSLQFPRRTPYNHLRYPSGDKIIHQATLLHRAILLICLLYFWGMGLQGLEERPRIYEDEAWIASPGYRFWSEGIYGSELMQGFYGMEDHYLAFMPLYSLAVGGWLKLTGLGLFQARLFSLLMSMLILALTYRLGNQLGGRWIGLLAIIILATWPIAAPTTFHQTGIPLADLARIARYDLGAVLFGMAALVMHSKGQAGWRSILIGLCCGLATLCHVYGVFWLVGFLIRRDNHPIKWLLVGFAAPVSLWGMYILRHWDAYQQQNRAFGDRIDPLNWRFYWESLLAEPQRYHLLWEQHTNLPTMMAFIFFMGGLLVLIYRDWQGNRAARGLLGWVGLLANLFALTINYKTFSYLAMLWPLFALVTAIGIATLWRWSSRQRILKGGMMLLLLLSSVYGYQRQIQLTTTPITPYSAFTTRLVASIPPDAHLLAMQHYWFELADSTTSYRSWLVPIFWANPAYVDRSHSLAEVLADQPPTVILLDEVMLHFLRSAANPQDRFHPLYLQINAYLIEQGAQLIAEFYDPTYGSVKLYQLP